MSKLMAVLVLGASLAVMGCNMHHDNDRDRDMNTSSNEPKKMSVDACPHCAGVQTATADGKCPVCGAKVQ